MTRSSLTRRDFLRATLVSVASASLAGAGCGDDNGDGGTDTGQTPGELLDGAAYFPQSVASGDPRPDSVILWTRLEDADLADADATLTVEVATDADFKAPLELDAAAATIAAAAKYDRCAKAKIKGLQPATTYYYRFIHERADGRYAGPVGQTRTAPADDADVAVRFAFVSCQDFNGRYYNSYRGLLQQPDLDFFVHLGDYIYETTGDPSFQGGGARQAKFSDTAGAIVFNEGTPDQYYAASSLSNYRELYRQYRADPAMRRVHERLPMVAIWDDHEYSNDCFGATATFYNGRSDELDVERRKRANQAWFEYMPVDFGDDTYAYDPAKPYLEDIKIYRDFRFGKHLHLVMTDLRSYRGDHLIPEDGFPGTIIMAAGEFPAELDAAASPYVADIDAFQGGMYAQALRTGAATLDYDAKHITGPIDATYINDLLVKLGQPVPAIDDTTLADLPRGLAFRHLGKLGFYTSIGSRYLVIKPTFDAWAKKLQAGMPASTNVMGDTQRQWFVDTMKASTATWKVWGNEYALSPIVVDLTKFPIDPFNQLFYMNVDQWDGFWPARDALIDALQAVDNVVAITGDIHAFYAGTPTVLGDPNKKIVEFVTGAISSTTFATILLLQVQSDPTLGSLPGAEGLASGIDALLTGVTTNPHLGFADSKRHGFVSLELDGAELRSTFHMLDEDVSLTDYEGKDDALAGLFRFEKFKVQVGQRDLFREIDGAYKRWDPSTNAWV